MHRKWIVLILLFSHASSGRSQEPFDSLLAKAIDFRENRHNHDSAMLYVRKAYDLAKIANNSEQIATSLIQFGIVNKDLGDFNASEKAFQKALGLFRNKLQDSAGIAKVYINLSILELARGNLEKSFDYAQESVGISTRLGKAALLAKGYICLANVLDEGGEPDSALAYNLKSIALLAQTNDSLAWAKANYGTGKRYFNLEKYAESEKYFKNALAFYEKQKNPKLLAETYQALGAILLNKRDFENAEKYTRLALPLLERNVDSQTIANAYFNLGMIQMTKEELTNANMSFDSSLSYLKGNYDQRNLVISNQVAVDAQLEKKRKNSILIIAVFSLGVVAILAIFFYFRSRSQRLQNKEIKAQYDKTIDALSNKYRLEQKEGVIDAMKKERQRIGKDLHDIVSTRLSVIRWSLESISKEMQGEIAAKLEPVIESAGIVYTEIYNIYNDLKKSPGEWLLSIKAFCQQIESVGLVKIDLNARESDVRVPDNIGSEAEKLVIELVTNALKHAKAKIIYIDITLIESNLNILVQDDGKGIDMDEQASWSGLDNLKTRVGELKGLLDIKSSGKGSVFFIQIPTTST